MLVEGAVPSLSTQQKRLRKGPFILIAVAGAQALFLLPKF
jgi:hypothetical protein